MSNWVDQMPANDMVVGSTLARSVGFPNALDTVAEYIFGLKYNIFSLFLFFGF